MSERASQRVALVTGGAVRIGRAIALGLAEAGHDLVISYHSSQGPAEDLERRVAALGRRCACVRADLREPAAAEELVSAARDAYGQLDVLVNSAASFDARPLLDVDAAAWDEVFALNARAPHLLVRAAAPLLRERGGCVVNMADLGAFQPWTEHPHHAISKAALVHLTRIQARVLAPEVRVNAVAPGAVLLPETWSEARAQVRARAAALKRLGTPQDVVDAVLYLIRARFVTGQVLTVDGGTPLG